MGINIFILFNIFYAQRNNLFCLICPNFCEKGGTIDREGADISRDLYVYLGNNKLPVNPHT
jgi:hypothetical protein